MEASETIFVNYLGYGCFDEPCVERVSTSQIEYIRKDVFIDKVVDYIAYNMRCDGYTLQTKLKFIKDFKRYMEGE